MRPAFVGRCIQPPATPRSVAASCACNVVTLLSPSLIVRHAFSTASAATAPSTLTAAASSNEATFGEGPMDTTAATPTPTSKFLSITDAKESFESLMKAKGDKDATKFIDIFAALAHHREFVIAFEMLSRMRDAQIDIPLDIYTKAFKAGIRTLRAFEIREFVGAPIPQRSSRQSNEEAESNSNSPLYPQCKQLFTWMKEEGKEPDLAFYEETCDYISLVENGGLMINVVGEMEQRGIQPSVRIYNKMLSLLPRSGFHDRADLLFSRLVANDMTNEATYVSRIIGLVQNRRMGEAEKIFEAMKKKNYEISTLVCNNMISGYFNINNQEKALAIFNFMKESQNPGCKPDSVTANILVNNLCSNNEPAAEGKKTIEMIMEAVPGFPTRGEDFACLLKYYARADSRKAAEMVAKLFRMAETSPDALEAVKTHNLFNGLLTIILDRGVDVASKKAICAGLFGPNQEHPTVEDGTLTAYCINAPIDFRLIVLKMETLKVPPTSVTYDLIMRMLRRRNDWRNILAVFENRVKDAYPLQSQGAFNHQLTALIESDPTNKTAIAWTMERMADRRFSLYPSVYARITELNIPVNRGLLNRISPRGTQATSNFGSFSTFSAERTPSPASIMNDF